MLPPRVFPEAMGRPLDVTSLTTTFLLRLPYWAKCLTGPLEESILGAEVPLEQVSVWIFIWLQCNVRVP